MAQSNGRPHLVGRSGHSAICLGGNRPQVVVVGGVDDAGNVLHDVWMLDVLSGRWKKVKGSIWYSYTF